MVNCIECKLIAFDLLNSSWKPIGINPQNVAIINPMKHVPSIHYGIPMPFKYMQNIQSMQVFMQQKTAFFCTRNLNCKPMILYGKYQLIQTYRVVLTYEARLTKMNRSQLIFTSTCWREWFKVWNGQMPKHNLKCDPLCQCAVLNSLHGIHAHAYTHNHRHIIEIIGKIPDIRPNSWDTERQTFNACISHSSPQ